MNANLPRATLASSLLLALSAAFWIGPGASGAAPPASSSPRPVTVAPGSGTWADVDRLVGEQKYEEASRLVAALRAKAQAARDEKEWTKSLVREVQLRTALHGYETAVRFLRSEAWPEGVVAQTTLDLFYGRTLLEYLGAYSWEIRQREKVESKEPVDLKRWTAEEIGAEARRAYERVFARRAEIGNEKLDSLSDFLQRGTYPPRVRDTLRDVTTYLFVELLADTSHWSPEQHEVHRLDRAALLGPAVGLPRDSATHPLARLAALLADLEEWHSAAGRREAALEARLERVRRLHASLTEPEDRRAIRADLEARLPAFRDVPWWAVGQVALAQLVREEDAPEAWVRARALATAALAAYPNSVGAQQARALVAEIEAPEYQLMSMSLDGPRRRSLQVDHRNLRALHFRAYPVDLGQRLRTAKDYNLLPGWNDVPNLVKAGTPAAQWSETLPATPDFRTHRTFVTPPLDTPGLYVVVASADPAFRRAPAEGNQLQAVNLLISDLVLVHRLVGDALEVTATSGKTGAALAGADVQLWRLSWNGGGHRVATRGTTGADGAVHLDLVGRDSPYALYGSHGRDQSLAGNVFWHITPPLAERQSSLVYTDRSVYRPQQRLLFKVVAYEGGGEDSRFRTAPGAAVIVSLVDANNQEVEQKTLTTNAFGSVAGEFQIPAGRLLGVWHVRTSLGGAASVRVEEYKRPTFEVALLDPQNEIRLNEEAKLRGEARYYFGLPVTTGKVSWRVTRQPVWPWWWWWSPGFDSRARVVASGEALLEADGRFPVTFTPEADPRAAREVTWTYALSADVTDEGGETRSATRSFRLGFVSVEARVLDVPGFVRAGTRTSIALRRTDLDGTPRAGLGTWTLLSLARPERTLLPAEQPLPPLDVSRARAHRTPGDAQRPRWDTQVTAEQILRQWEDAAGVAEGTATHDARGEASVSLPPLPPGPYRLRYETKDARGGTFRMSQELVVAAAEGTLLPVPGILAVEKPSVKVGETARVLVHSGLAGQPMTLELWRSGRRTGVRHLVAGRSPQIVELPVGEKERGGFGITLTVVRDHQAVRDTATVFVPWDDRELKVAFSTFRDRLRPGNRETWRVTVAGSDEARTPAAAAEVLAYMYDRSLDLFAPHSPASALGVYPNRTGVGVVHLNLTGEGAQWSEGMLWLPQGGHPLQPDRLDFWSGYALGGPGRRSLMRVRRGDMAQGVEGGVPGGVLGAAAGGVVSQDLMESVTVQASGERRHNGNFSDKEEDSAKKVAAPPPPPPAGDADRVALRSEFSETAFWQPQLLTGPDGQATFEFTVPDSVTSWSVWTHALTRDLRAGSQRTETRTVKDLMVRPYLPRFLREGDRAEIKVVVNNASTARLEGGITFDIRDPLTDESLLSAFGVEGGRPLTFAAPASGSASVTVPIVTPRRLGPVAIKVIARSGDLSDGELRSLPVLPSRMHLVESRFATLKGATRRTLDFPALARGDDPTRETEQLVVTLDAQLFYGVLEALPYLVDYPYECTEQTLNRFVSTGIVSSLFTKYPSVARMATEMSKRDTRLETWDRNDPNRRMQLEETPWLTAAKGGAEPEKDLVKILDPRIARATREEALSKLRKAQTAIGGFPWWPGGPPSPYMTLYIVHGLAKAREFGVEVPQDMVRKAFAYLHRHYLDEWVRESVRCECGWEFVTFLNYVLTSFPDDTWTDGVFTAAERKSMLDFSFRHWKAHTPYLKGYLALTLHRRGRPADARLVWASVMDSSRTDPDTGTSWAPEDRAWLWYNDTIETHAFALRTLTELSPRDPRREGLVQWLFLHKKLNHWDSTRSTAEVLYALAHYLQQEGQLGAREEATVRVGALTRTFAFEPDRYTGKHNQMVVPGRTVDASKSGSVVVEKTTPGLMFASATWHYATDKLPTDEAGDLFAVSRRYFRRENKAGTWTLAPLSEGTTLAPGDEVEVHLSLRAKQPAEYVHLRDPRGAGFEPATLVSGFKWQTGLGFYEEVRDSGENFFFEWLPQGEYTFKYRLRATTAGRFRVAPAQVQSMYAPEFAARSAGAELTIGGAR